MCIIFSCSLSITDLLKCSSISKLYPVRKITKTEILLAQSFAYYGHSSLKYRDFFSSVIKICKGYKGSIMPEKQFSNFGCQSITVYVYQYTAFMISLRIFNGFSFSLYTEVSNGYIWCWFLQKWIKVSSCSPICVPVQLFADTWNLCAKLYWTPLIHLDKQLRGHKRICDLRVSHIIFKG